jgi:arginine decarboxylase
VLSVQGEPIDRDRLHIVFELEPSTSASLIAADRLDRRTPAPVPARWKWLLGEAVDRAQRLRAAIDEIPGLKLVDEAGILGQARRRWILPTSRSM